MVSDEDYKARIRRIVENRSELGACSECGLSPYTPKHPYNGRWAQKGEVQRWCYGSVVDRIRYKKYKENKVTKD